MRFFTAGHGARPVEELIRTLHTGPTSLVVDVRRFPGSRRHPQFGQVPLGDALRHAGLEYAWLPRLGGRRQPQPGPSPNPAWRVEAFRAYADYMDAPEFAQGIDELMALAARHPSATAVMCAETHPSHCHRRLLADKLWSLGHEVVHLVTPERQELHHPPPFLRIEDGRLRYDLGIDADGQVRLL
jgi:uncharacterized protein (DUF488 family)